VLAVAAANFAIDGRVAGDCGRAGTSIIFAACTGELVGEANVRLWIYKAGGDVYLDRSAMHINHLGGKTYAAILQRKRGSAKADQRRVPGGRLDIRPSYNKKGAGIRIDTD